MSMSQAVAAPGFRFRGTMNSAPTMMTQDNTDQTVIGVLSRPHRRRAMSLMTCAIHSTVHSQHRFGQADALQERNEAGIFAQTLCCRRKGQTKEAAVPTAVADLEPAEGVIHLPKFDAGHTNQERVD